MGRMGRSDGGPSRDNGPQRRCPARCECIQRIDDILGDPDAIAPLRSDRLQHARVFKLLHGLHQPLLTPLYVNEVVQSEAGRHRPTHEAQLGVDGVGPQTPHSSWMPR